MPHVMRNIVWESKLQQNTLAVIYFGSLLWWIQLLRSAISKESSLESEYAAHTQPERVCICAKYELKRRTYRMQCGVLALICGSYSN